MIVVVSSELPPAGGVGEIAGQIVDAAASSGAQISLITDSGVAAKTSSNRSGSRSLLASVRMALALSRALVDPVVRTIILVDTRAIYVFGALTALSLGARAHHKKVVCILHGSELERFVLRANWKRQLAQYPRLIVRSLSKVNKVYCVSGFLVRKWTVAWSLGGRQAGLMRRHHRPTFEVLNLPLPDYFTGQSSGIVSDLNDHLQQCLSGHCNYILTVGRLDPGKGVLSMAQLMFEVLSKDPELSWVIVGKGRLQSELEAAVASQPRQVAIRIAILGHISRVKLPEIYRNALCFLGLSELPEGLGLAWVEALAMGTPVLARPVGALKGIINSRNGRLSHDNSILADELLRHFWHDIDAEFCAESVRRWTGGDGMNKLLGVH